MFGYAASRTKKLPAGYFGVPDAFGARTAAGLIDGAETV
jgi:hypothetical protein